MLLAAALAVLPSFLAGQSGELLIRTAAPEVVVLVNDRLDGASGCYAVIRGPLAWARDQRSGVWTPGGGWPCRVTSAESAEGLRVGIEFAGDAAGLLSVFVQTRPGASRWYRAGKWEVTNDGVAALPPAAIAGPPGPPGAEGKQGPPGPPGATKAPTAGWERWGVGGPVALWPLVVSGDGGSLWVGSARMTWAAGHTGEVAVYLTESGTPNFYVSDRPPLGVEGWKLSSSTLGNAIFFGASPPAGAFVVKVRQGLVAEVSAPNGMQRMIFGSTPPSSEPARVGDCARLKPAGDNWIPGYPVVYRNGLRLWVGLDYEATDDLVRPIGPVSKWDDGDVVIGCR